MDHNQVSFFEPGIRALICPNCQAAARLKQQGDQLRCPECSASYWIVDGVIDLMSENYRGYPGDSQNAAALRDAHNRQSLRTDTVQLRNALDQRMRSKALVLDAGCGTGQLARIISESRPDVTVIATDVSLPMCRLAAKNCRDLPVMVVRTPSSKIPPMPFENLQFDIVLNRLAPMDPQEAYRLLRPGGYAINAAWVDVHWCEIRHVFPKDRLITFPQDLEPKEAFFQAGFDQAESHAWRFTRVRPLDEIIRILKYAPVIRDFDETVDRPFLSKLETLYGEGGGIRLTEGESLVIGHKGESG